LSIWPRIGAAAIALLIVGVGAMTYVLTPGHSSLIPPCPFYRLTGLHCPGCGMLRSLHQLLHGNLLGAWRFNPFVVVYVPLTGYALAFLGALAISGKRLASPSIPPKVAWGALIAILAFGVARNIPVYPLTLLAPH
jgi:hypothetical protein